MKKFTILGMTAVTGIALAASVTAPVYAWHPEGKITKYVTNVTASGTMQDANDVKTAVAAKPGDILKYTIVISNPAQPAADKHNDLMFVNLKDELPTGVELTTDAAKRIIDEKNIGTIVPGKSITKEYTVKVTATKDGVITNKACFDGNSEVKDARREGCDVAVVKVTVPPVVTPPTTPETPKTPEQPAPIGKGAVAKPAELPATGPASIIAIVAGATVAGYAANMLRLRFAGRRG